MKHLYFTGIHALLYVCMFVGSAFILFMLVFVWAAVFCSHLIWSCCGSAAKDGMKEKQYPSQE